MKVLIVFAAIGLLSACSRSSVLDEARARALVVATPQVQIFQMSVNELLPIMEPSRDARRPETNQVLRRLLDAKLVEERTTLETYPNLSGLWVYKPTESRWTPKSFELHQAEGSNEITGKCDAGGWISTLKGTVDTEGRVELIPLVRLQMGSDPSHYISPGERGECLGRMAEIDYRYSQEGTEGHLQQTSWGDDLFLGKLAGNTSVKLYSYTFSPRVTVAGHTVSAGRYEVGQVSDLILATETRATGNFAWIAKLDQLGEILLDGLATPSGSGTAQFAKKPDGNWVVTNLRF